MRTRRSSDRASATEDVTRRPADGVDEPTATARARRLPPAQAAVRLGGGPVGRRWSRRMVVAWLVVSGLDALVAYGGWGLPAVAAALVLAVCVGVELLVTAVAGVSVGLLHRASVATGPGWVGVRLLGRWKVVEAQPPPGPWWGAGTGPIADADGPWDGDPWDGGVGDGGVGDGGVGDGDPDAGTERARGGADPGGRGRDRQRDRGPVIELPPARSGPSPGSAGDGSHRDGRVPGP